MRIGRHWLALLWTLALIAKSEASPATRAPSDVARGAAASEQVKKRLNQILYWQLADELKLAPKTEKAMVGVIEDIQQKRESALRSRAEALNEIKLHPESREALKRLRKALAAMSSLDLEEYEALEKVLGPDVLGRFYMVREKVAEKISLSIKEAH